ncbi:MAG: hypothetical protein WAK89_19650 [Candidatus Sulfotelmatobacter sp.]
MSDSLDNPVPQFGTAEYSSQPAGNRCRICQQPLGGTYYRVNTAMVCPSCAQKMRGAVAVDNHAAYVRALAYGIGAAVAGLAGYALIAILLQGWVISYMSIGVGWIVGTAMIRGSNGIGGRRYQIAAAVLTYAAVSMAAVPIWIHFASVRHPQKQTHDQRFEEEERKFGNDAEQQQTDAEPAPRAEKPRMSFGTWLGTVVLLGLASPFIQLSGNLLWGAIGLLILFWGIRIAWRITAGRQFEIYGPFADSPPASL